MSQIDKIQIGNQTYELNSSEGGTYDDSAIRKQVNRNSDQISYLKDIIAELQKNETQSTSNDNGRSKYIMIGIQLADWSNMIVSSDLNAFVKEYYKLALENMEGGEVTNEGQKIISRLCSQVIFAYDQDCLEYFEELDLPTPTFGQLYTWDDFMFLLYMPDVAILVGGIDVNSQGPYINWIRTVPLNNNLTP